MAYINKTDKVQGCVVCLTKDDCLVFRPQIKAWLFVARKQFERLANIYESGMATEKQQKSYVIAKQRYGSLASTLTAIDDMVREP